MKNQKSSRKMIVQRPHARFGKSHTAGWSNQKVKGKLLDILEWIWLTAEWDTKKAEECVYKLDDVMFEIEQLIKHDKKNKTPVVS